MDSPSPLHAPPPAAAPERPIGAPAQAPGEEAHEGAPAEVAGPNAAPLPNADAASALAVLREWFDALVVAFILAMFIRVFCVELFKIPTGSMTPTLVGGIVAQVDYDQDGMQDLLLSRGQELTPLLFLNNGRRLVGQGEASLPGGPLPTLEYHEEYDRILVNKFAYWFHPPRRGDIVVFKVPRRIWDEDKPIYIKRCVGEPGDGLDIADDGGLIANGQRVKTPDFFSTQIYRKVVDRYEVSKPYPPEIQYDTMDDEDLAVRHIDVPRDEIVVFGDNAWGSLDSRYWGGVPLNNLKGRAFLKFWPLNQIKFLRDE